MVIRAGPTVNCQNIVGFVVIYRVVGKRKGGNWLGLVLGEFLASRMSKRFGCVFCILPQYVMVLLSKSS